MAGRGQHCEKKGQKKVRDIPSQQFAQTFYNRGSKEVPYLFSVFFFVLSPIDTTEDKHRHSALSPYSIFCTKGGLEFYQYALNILMMENGKISASTWILVRQGAPVSNSTMSTRSAGTLSIVDGPSLEAGSGQNRAEQGRARQALIIVQLPVQTAADFQLAARSGAVKYGLQACRNGAGEAGRGGEGKGRKGKGRG